MVANAINYLYHLVMGRVLGPSDYGVLASLYSILYLIGIIPASASVAVVKFISSAKKQETYSIYVALGKFVSVLAFVVSVLFLVFSPLIAKFLNISGVWSVTIVSPILFLTLITLTNQATSQGLLKFWGIVIPTLISSFVKFALGITLVFIGWSVFGAMFAIAVGLGLAFWYSAWFIRRNLAKMEVKKYSLGPFLKYSLPVLLQSLAFTSLFSTDVLLVKHFFDPFQAGIYAALSTLGKIIFFATSPVTATMFPIVSKRHALGEGHRKVFMAALVITVSVSALITAFYWLFPNIAIGILYGSAYLSASAELVWMGIFILFYSISSLFVNYSLSLGNSKVIAFPLLGAAAQIPLIWLWHGSILQVIQISLVISVVMFLGIGAFLKYNLSLR